MVGMRWTIRSIGLVNTIILARLLTPQDFGLVAMATVVIGLLDSVTDFNVELPLLRNRAIGRCHYDSAWTLQVLSGLSEERIVSSVSRRFSPPIMAIRASQRSHTLLLFALLLRASKISAKSTSAATYGLTRNFVIGSIGGY